MRLLNVASGWFWRPPAKYNNRVVKTGQIFQRIDSKVVLQNIPGFQQAETGLIQKSDCHFLVQLFPEAFLYLLIGTGTLTGQLADRLFP